jgi:hypothetical protein
MSFGESVFPVGFNQKTAEGDLFVKRNYRILSRELRGKTLEDSRSLSTERDHMPLTCGTARPQCQADQPLVGPTVSLFATSVLHRLLGCILAVISSRFDPRAKD